MKYFYTKFLLVFTLLFTVSFAWAQSDGPGIPSFDPPKSPIDTYIYILAIIGVILTIIFAKKYRAQKSIN